MTSNRMNDLWSRMDRFISKVPYLILALFSAVWFYPLRGGILMGDDMGAVLYYRQISNVFQATFAYTGGNKYRPVFNLFQFMAVKAFDNHYLYYFALNVLLNLVIASLLYRLLLRISGSPSAAVALSLLYLSSRFAYYNITQVNGSVEALPILFLVLIVTVSYDIFKDGKTGRAIWLPILALLAVYSHERYIALSLYLVLFFLVAPGFRMLQRTFYILLGVVPVASNILVKTYVLNAQFLEGTGGQAIQLDIRRVLYYAYMGTLNVLGVNNGPEYLNGYTFAAMPIALQAAMAAAALLLTGFLVCSLADALRRLKRDGRLNSESVLLILLILLLGMVLATGTVTIRVEQRWLFAPYLVLLVIIALCLAKYAPRRSWMVPLYAGFLVITLFLNVQYVRNRQEIFFFRAMGVAKSMYQQTVARYGPALKDHAVIIENHGELEWPMGDTDFFKVYNVYSNNIRYVDNIYASADYPAGAICLRLDHSLQVRQVEPETIRNVQAIQTQYTAVHDYSREFQAEGVSPALPASTPSGLGAFMLGTEGLTVISPYRYTVGQTAVQGGESLVLTSSLPLEQSDGLCLTVDLKGQKGELVRSFEYDGKSDIYIEVIPLDAFTGQQIAISVGVSSSNGNTTADWLTFSRLGIYRQTAVK